MGRRQQIIQRAYDFGQSLPDWPRPKRPRIRLVTAFNAPIADYGEIAAARMAAYARHHGYDLRVYRDGFDPARPPAWSKILFVQRAFAGADWVVWIDADILIMDLSQPLEQWLSPDHDFIIARHHAPQPHANTGIFFARPRLWVRGFLRQVYAQKEVIHHGWWEQVALNIVLENHRLPRLLQVDNARAFNASFASAAPEDVYQPGDFLVHFAGQPNRASRMREFLARVAPGT